MLPLFLPMAGTLLRNLGIPPSTLLPLRRSTVCMGRSYCIVNVPAARHTGTIWVPFLKFSQYAVLNACSLCLCDNQPITERPRLIGLKWVRHCWPCVCWFVLIGRHPPSSRNDTPVIILCAIHEAHAITGKATSDVGNTTSWRSRCCRLSLPRDYKHREPGTSAFANLEVHLHTSPNSRRG